MMGRGVIFVALATYLAVVGCVVWPGSSAVRGTNDAPDAEGGAEAGSLSIPVTPRPSLADRPKLTGLPYRGVAMQLQRIDLIDEYKKGIDEIAALGADTVSIVVDSRQENGSSARIFIDLRKTPTPAQLGEVIRHAKSRKLRVVLMPIVLLDNPRGKEWRGTIRPESWDEWFRSYREMIVHYAWIAEANGVDLLVVGSELVSTESKAAEWDKTIRAVRQKYKGQLTYSANWDHYSRIPFWNQLDLIGMNSYYKLGNDHTVSVEEIERRWRDIQKDLLAFQRRMNKPLLLLEAGWCSLRNAAHEPWDYTKLGEPIDLQLQRKLYEGFFRAWHGQPSLGGFIIWEWPPGEGGRNDKGYTPENKPAQEVMREWFAKPW